MFAVACGVTCVLATVVRVHCVVSSLLARVPAVLSDGSLVFCALFYAFDMCGSESFAELWAMLPCRFRTEYGCAGGVVPSSNVLAFLVDSPDDMASLVAQYAPGEAHLGHEARALWTAVQCEATAACKRRSLVDPAWQRVLLARRDPHSEATAPALCDTLSWLRSKSGACRRSGKLLLRSSKQLSQAEDGSLARLQTSRGSFIGDVSRRSWFPKPDCQLQRRRNSLLLPRTLLLRPLVLLGLPQFARRFASGARMRKVLNFSLGACGWPWPSHVGIVLDYLRERVDEPCGRTVPEAVVSAFAFMEKVGCVPGPERVSASQILRKKAQKGHA